MITVPQWAVKELEWPSFIPCAYNYNWDVISTWYVLCSWRVAYPIFVLVPHIRRCHKQAHSFPWPSCLLSHCNWEQPLWCCSFLKCRLFLPVLTVNASTCEMIRPALCWFTDHLAWGERLSLMRDNTLAGKWYILSWRVAIRLEFLMKVPILLWRLAHHAHYRAFNTLIFCWSFGRQS